ncbi:hypothetical protein CRUP_019732 [Coryphaenoides rupestris]|nr:hypothetical protein CRUP_019732 [Coryphaenoides rupestris]
MLAFCCVFGSGGWSKHNHGALSHPECTEVCLFILLGRVMSAQPTQSVLGGRWVMSAVQGVLLLGFLLHLWPPGSVQGALVVSRYDGAAEEIFFDVELPKTAFITNFSM